MLKNFPLNDILKIEVWSFGFENFIETFKFGFIRFKKSLNQI